MGDFLGDIQVIFLLHDCAQAAFDLLQAGQLFGIFLS